MPPWGFNRFAQAGLVMIAKQGTKSSIELWDFYSERDFRFIKYINVYQAVIG